MCTTYFCVFYVRESDFVDFYRIFLVIWLRLGLGLHCECVLSFLCSFFPAALDCYTHTLCVSKSIRCLPTFLSSFNVLNYDVQYIPRWWSLVLQNSSSSSNNSYNNTILLCNGYLCSGDFFCYPLRFNRIFISNHYNAHKESGGLWVCEWARVSFAFERIIVHARTHSIQSGIQWLRLAHGQTQYEEKYVRTIRFSVGVCVLVHCALHIYYLLEMGIWKHNDCVCVLSVCIHKSQIAESSQAKPSQAEPSQSI